MSLLVVADRLAEDGLEESEVADGGDLVLGHGAFPVLVGVHGLVLHGRHGEVPPVDAPQQLLVGHLSLLVDRGARTHVRQKLVVKAASR